MAKVVKSVKKPKFDGVFPLERENYLILGLALLTNWATIRLRRMPLGRAWEALREGARAVPRC